MLDPTHRTVRDDTAVVGQQCRLLMMYRSLWEARVPNTAVAEPGRVEHRFVMHLEAAPTPPWDSAVAGGAAVGGAAVPIAIVSSPLTDPNERGLCVMRGARVSSGFESCGAAPTHCATPCLCGPAK